MDDDRRKLLDSYFKHTREILPGLSNERGWAAMEESHFQRIVLDHVAGGVWYGKIKEPAALHLSKSQLKKAIRLCESLISGAMDFDELNAQSLAWRNEKGIPPGLEHYTKTESPTVTKPALPLRKSRIESIQVDDNAAMIERESHVIDFTAFRQARKK